MTAQEIRQKFLDFFEEKGHKIVSSAPIVVKNDPTLMFTNAGMNQFKDIFLGDKDPDAKRVADAQKCLRVSGKHNDLEEVGHDTYHHTMFEMLGNWSFGDYFKEEAIDWAFELLTKEYGIDKDRLYATVFEGDEETGVSADAEALEAWKKYLPEDRILYGTKEDNFWEMGDTGPCGPSSEIHIDLRSDEEREKVNGAELVNMDRADVLELWNLVFIQYNRKTDGTLEKLKQQHVDTGMGFERLCMVLQGKTSNYDTGAFSPIIDEVSRLSGKKYGKDEKTNIAFRVVADHIRAIAFTIADGQLPGNTGAGYVVRRILRRAVRYGYSYLGFTEPFLYSLLSVMEKMFKDTYPEISQQKEFVQKVIHEEEQSFLRTLSNGLKRLEQIKEQVDDKKEIPGQVVFELYDTYGFPADLTRLIAREWGYTIDEKGFEHAMQEQKSRSREATSLQAGDWVDLDSASRVKFVGYDQTETEAKLLKYRKVKQKKKELYQVVLDETPFYAESGGQIGDTGYLQYNGEQINVFDTQKENELIVHYVDKLPDNLPEKVTARINEEKRRKTAANHSATHLLHAALRKVLGEHVGQKGSYVGPDHLRFDFSHFEKMKAGELEKVERIVNEKIWQNIHRKEERNVPFEEAKKKGAMALFGEKYGDEVRVITFDDDYSIELCGGTHVESTGQIGLFKITQETSVAAGVRRIEAMTGEGAYRYVNERLEQLKKVAELAKNPSDVVKGVESLAEENKKLKRELEEMSAKHAQAEKGSLKDDMEKIGEVNFLGKVLDLGDGGQLKNLCFQLKNEEENIFAILATESNGKPLLNIVISENLVEKYDLNAGKMIREIAQQTIKGGGGGQAFFASAGGSDVSGMEAAIAKAKEMVDERVGG